MEAEFNYPNVCQVPINHFGYGFEITKKWRIDTPLNTPLRKCCSFNKYKTPIPNVFQFLFSNKEIYLRLDLP